MHDHEIVDPFPAGRSVPGGSEFEQPLHVPLLVGEDGVALEKHVLVEMRQAVQLGRFGEGSVLHHDLDGHERQGVILHGDDVHAVAQRGPVDSVFPLLGGGPRLMWRQDGHDGNRPYGRPKDYNFFPDSHGANPRMNLSEGRIRTRGRAAAVPNRGLGKEAKPWPPLFLARTKILHELRRQDHLKPLGPSSGRAGRAGRAGA